MEFWLNNDELAALCGLPHLQQLVYLRGIRPYMDVTTNQVGIRRKISYQSIAEQLYVEPHPGVQSGSPSRQQLRRAVKALERAGVIAIQSMEKQLILSCLLASRHFSAQNKPDTKPAQQPDTDAITKKPILSMNKGDNRKKADIAKLAEADTPHNNNYYFIFLSEQFEKFWALYPLKRSKQQAWKVFQTLRPDEALISTLLQSLQQQCETHALQKAQGQWVPNWCNPTNWLTQRRWEDEINLDVEKEIWHAAHQKPFAQKSVTDPFWQPCKTTAQPAKDNVIDLKQYRDHG